jgi:hypothetical protein
MTSHFAGRERKVGVSLRSRSTGSFNGDAPTALTGMAIRPCRMGHAIAFAGAFLPMITTF